MQTLKEDALSELLAQQDPNKPIVVLFSADWCGPCKTLEPHLVAWEAELGDTASVVKLNVDHAQKSARAQAVRSVPTLIVFRNGKEVRRRTGSGTLPQLRALLT